MLHFTQGNLLLAETEAIVNTVNTVGVMGKGIALMFRETFPQNYAAYAAACKAGDVKVGQMFVTETRELTGPKWIVNFPTKQHWRNPSRLEWIVNGLQDLRRVLVEKGVRSVAIPPLGCGNGGLDWADVKPEIETALGDLSGVDVMIYEPVATYQNPPKRSGVLKLTPARALVVEAVRRYWILGIECTILEVQKLGWFLERSVESMAPDKSLKLRFNADRYGPYSDNLRHLLNDLDGSYLHCEKRLSDAGPLDVIWFEEQHRARLQDYLGGDEAAPYIPALEHTADLIDGFESPLGMEALATVDWLITRERCAPTLERIKAGLAHWPAGAAAANRKLGLFDDRLIGLALKRLSH